MARRSECKDAALREITSPRGLVTRRQAALGLAGLAASAAVPLSLPFPASASDGPEPHRLSVGEAQVLVFSDGYMELPVATVLPDQKPQEAGALLQPDGAPASTIRAPVNVTLVKTGPDVVLIDAGGGAEFVPGVGLLADRLARAGIALEAVTAVIFTHAHPDHFWGVIDPLSGESLFPSARLYMNATERDYWLAPAREGDVPEPYRGIAAGIKRRLTELGERITDCPPGAEPIPGLLVVDTAGHTPGHVSVHLTSKGQDLLVGGDVLTHGVVSFAHPDVRWGTDVNSQAAIRSRHRMLDMLATDTIALLGYHLPWPGVGRVERSGSSFRFVLQ